MRLLRLSVVHTVYYIDRLIVFLLKFEVKLGPMQARTRLSIEISSCSFFKKLNCGE